MLARIAFAVPLLLFTSEAVTPSLKENAADAWLLLVSGAFPFLMTAICLLLVELSCPGTFEYAAQGDSALLLSEGFNDYQDARQALRTTLSHLRCGGVSDDTLQAALQSLMQPAHRVPRSRKIPFLQSH